MRLRLKGALRLMSVEILSTGNEASSSGESLNNSGEPAFHPAARHMVDISYYGFCWRNFGGESGLELGPCFNTDAWRGFKLWQVQRAAGLCVIQF